MKENFHHEIKNNPDVDDVGKVKVTATIIREDDNLTFSTSTLVREFIDDDDNESKVALNGFLVEAGLSEFIITHMLFKLVCYVDDVTDNEYSWDTPSLLEVKMDLEPDPLDYEDFDWDDDGIVVDDGENFDDDDDDDDDYDDDDYDDDDNGYDDDHDEDDTGLEEAVQQLSFDENNIRLRPASQLAVNGLPRNVYQKNGFNAEPCSVCQEEFDDGKIVVSLPCGHDFDEDCIVKWFETSHVCPLCRFQLPFDD